MKRKETLTRAGTRYLLTALVALAFAMMLAVPAAFAVEGKITIATNDTGGSQPSGLKYEGYQIFKADVDKTGNASNFTWANDNVKTAVLAAIAENEGSVASPATTIVLDGKTLTIADLSAQDAAGYIKAKFPAGGTYETMVEDDEFAMALAKKIQSSSATKKEITPGGSGATFDEGYVLVLTKDGTLTGDVVDGKKGVDGSATSPIFALINGKDDNIADDVAIDVDITEKAKVPTITKEVEEDRAEVYVVDAAADPAYYELKDGTFTTTSYANADAADKAKYVDTTDAVKYAKKADNWGTVADAMIGQDLRYRLTGTITNNLVSFDTYYYEFEDNMTRIAMKDNNVSSVVVKIKTGGTEYTVVDGYTATYDATASKLRVVFNDLKKTQDATMKAAVDENTANPDPNFVPSYIPLDQNTVVTVLYEAHLTSDAYIGAAQGNPNVVKIHYSRNPTNSEKGTTEEKENKLYTYALDILKVDKNQERTTLDGVKFLLWNAGKDAVAEVSGGKFVKWVPATHKTSGIDNDYYETYKLVTAGGGKLKIEGLDEGTYVLQETNTLSGYEIIPEVNFQIISTLADAPVSSTTLRATLSGGNGDGVDSNSDGYIEQGTGLTSVTNNTGVVAAKVTNEKKITMPLTGMDGITFTYILGGLILAVSVFALLRRKMVNNNVQEDVA